MKKYDVIIIGAGMAGLTAGIYAIRGGKSVLVLESNAVGGQIMSALRIENWPGDLGISGKDLMKKVSEQATELGVEIRYEEVVKIKKNVVRFIVVTDEDEYDCGAVIIATGTEPRKLSAKQTEDAGKRPISYCAICDGALYKGKPVVVVGSGNTAKHEIKYLGGICSKVYHIHHDEPIPKDAEAVFVAIGRVPSTDFLGDLVERDEEGYVVADETCMTACPGVLAAGDCRTKPLRQLVTAAADGAMAAAVAGRYLKELNS
ncbi:FAD-dependent oxidoreductase [Candidatus Saccharibacteria bacterium]|nr:FAD-dependent oxidoreductase [Candidatus Saccharibacteria bacterium]